MSVKRFVAADMRRALELVKQEMGPDAIILASNRTKAGVEIVTSDDENYRSVAAPQSLFMTNSFQSEEVVNTSLSESHNKTSLINKFKPKKALSEERKYDTDFNLMLREQIKAQENGVLVNLKKGIKKDTLGEQSAFDHYMQKASASDNSIAELNDNQTNAHSKFQCAELLHLASFQYEPGFTNVKFDLANGVNNKVSGNKQNTNELSSTDEDYIGMDDFLDEQFIQLKSEISEMRKLLQQQISGKALDSAAQDSAVKSTPTIIRPNTSDMIAVNQVIQRRLVKLGFPSSEIKKCIFTLNKSMIGKVSIDLAQAWESVIADIAHRLTNRKEQVKVSGRVEFFVGAKNSGKTDLIGKFASQHVLKHGVGKLIVISMKAPLMSSAYDKTTDEKNKLDRHCKILSIPHFIAHTVNDVVQIISQYSATKKIFVSMPPLCTSSLEKSANKYNGLVLKEMMRTIELKSNIIISASNKIAKTQKITPRSSISFSSNLVLPATESKEVIRKILAESESSQKMLNFSSCTITKIDEAEFSTTPSCSDFGSIVGELLAHNLPVFYTTNGVSLPQYLQMAKGLKLVAIAVGSVKKKSQVKLKNKSELKAVVNQSQTLSALSSEQNLQIRLSNAPSLTNPVPMVSLKQVATP